jgi:hypothetical protein
MRNLSSNLRCPRQSLDDRSDLEAVEREERVIFSDLTLDPDHIIPQFRADLDFALLLSLPKILT